MITNKYEDYLKKDAMDKLDLFMGSLSISNRAPSYYVNWDKVTEGTKAYELELNTLNYLIGKEDIYRETYELFSRFPELIRALPSLLASRDRVMNVLTLIDNDLTKMSYDQLNFEKVDRDNLKAYVDFAEESGLLDFLQNKAKRSLVDYVYGVEAGLDSNARKNRSGTVMEDLVEIHIKGISSKLGLEYQSQASAKNIKQFWGRCIPVDKAKRRFDLAVFNPRNDKIWLIETNYYGGGGSKLKATAGEFINLHNYIKSSGENIEFIWITDGQGWLTAREPLSEAFGQMEFIFNLDMLKNKILYDALK